MMKSTEWVTITKAAELCGVSVNTIRNWRAKGIFEWRQVQPGVQRSPVYIKKLDLPTFARKAQESMVSNYQLKNEGVKTK